MSEAEDRGLEAVQAALAKAVEFKPSQDEGRADPPPHDAPPGEPLEPQCGSRLPEDCPVKPLGINGDFYYYLDANHQLRTVKVKDHGRLGIQGLFGNRIEELYRHWPSVDKEGRLKSWRAEKVAEALMAAAADCGVWNVMGRTRGPGAWLTETGALVYHVGDGLIFSGEPGGSSSRGGRPSVHPPGPDGRFVYPAAAPQPRPAEDRVPVGPGGPAQKVLDLLQTWHWRRGEVDAHLVLGWICAGIVSGALDWRPLLWIAGDKATGKSTLHKLIAWLLGDGLVSVADATPAGIWQKLGHASLPVAFDELEADEDNRRVNKVVELARLAASGALLLRGGADHVGSEFVARSCFLFSSILIPPLRSQDRSRMAILELKRLESITPPKMDAKSMGQLGAQLRRRMLDQWPRFAETLEAYRQELATNAGHGGRGADVFGTLLACADLALFDAPPESEALAGWSKKLKAVKMAEVRETGGDHESLLDQIRTSVLDVWRGGTKTTVGQILLAAAGKLDDAHADGLEAGRVLGTYGMRYLVYPPGTKLEGEWVAFANSHQGLARLLEGTHWAKRSGTTGVWVQALERVQGARHANLRFAGVASRCVLVPFNQVLPDVEEGASEN